MQRQLKNYAQPYHKFVEAYEARSLEGLNKCFDDNREIFVKVRGIWMNNKLYARRASCLFWPIVTHCPIASPVFTQRALQQTQNRGETWGLRSSALPLGKKRKLLLWKTHSWRCPWVSLAKKQISKTKIRWNHFWPRWYAASKIPTFHLKYTPNLL